MQSLAHAIIVLWGWRRFAVAVVAGALSAFAFAPFYVVPILWLTVPVFVWLIDGAEPGEGAGFFRRLVPAAVVGFAFGFGFFVAGLWWIGMAFLVDAGGFVWALPLAVVLLPAGLALFWAFGAALARALWTEGWPRIVVFAVAMSAAEWLRGHLFTGFPWNAFGYALTPLPVMMQSTAVVGIWGVTVATFFIFAAPVVLASADRSGRAARGVVAAAVVLLVADFAFGAARLAHGPDPLVDGVRLRIMQPAIPQDERWQTGHDAEIMSRYVSLSRGANGLAGITHLIWPESAFPFLLTERPDALQAIADLLPQGTTLITGAARAEHVTGGDAPRLIYNSAYVIDDAGEISGAYDKVHLVPFGEYLPFRGLLGYLGLRQLIALPGGFSPGDALRTLPIAGAPSAGVLICYEIVFPGDVVEPGNRPGWLVNLTNDAWYGDTPGPYQHFLEARVRAVEEGLPLVRAANSGISAIVDAHGRIVASLGLGLIGIVDGGLPASLPITPYARFGDLMFLLIMMAAAGVAIFGKMLRRRQPAIDSNYTG